MLLLTPSTLTTRISGIMIDWNGITIAAMNRKNNARLNSVSERTMRYAPIALMSAMSSTLMDVINRELVNASGNLVSSHALL
ncbi:hypothetical protein D3C77_622030 [compost metagenome]